MTGESNPSGSSGASDQPWSEQIRHSQVGALVPAHVARGVFSTGAVVLEGPHEFVVDFLLRMAKPHQLVARVIMAPQVLGRFVTALRQNVEMYEKQFGDQRTRALGIAKDDAAKSTPEHAEGSPAKPAETDPSEPNVAMAGAGLPEPKGASANDPTGESSAAQAPQRSGTSVSELYEQIKLPDELLSGCYANAVMIGHSPSEFSFDFISTFFPRSAVSCRVFMSAGSTRVFLNSLTHAFEQHSRHRRTPPPSPPGIAEP